MRRIWTLGLLAACGGREDTDTGAVAEGPTFDEVAPILERSCTGCHQEGGAAPFALTTQDAVKAWAPAIAAAVESRAMPPWLVTDDGSCGTFRESRWLDDADVDALVGWVEAGARAGATQTLEAAPAPTLDRRDLSFPLPEIVPEPEGDLFAPNDEYRCFLVADPTVVDQFLTGYEVEPGNTAIVHHVLAMPVDPSATSWTGETTNAQEIASMDGVDGRPGWDCLGTSGGYIREKGIPVTWAPGQGAVELPEGLGVRLAADDVLVVQVHYSMADPTTVGQSDQTTIHFRAEDEVDKEAFFALPDPLLESMFDYPNHDTIPAGKEAYDYVWEMSSPEMLARAGVPEGVGADGFELWGVMPHMHQRGTKQRVEILRGGEPECAADVPRWNFEWQLLYFYEQPLTIGASDAIRVTCTYDTRGDAAPILPGWGTDNEMCLAVLVLTVDR